MPFLFGQEIFIIILNKLLKDNNNPIKYVYGNVNSKWSGGRFPFFNITNINHIDKYLTKLEKYNLIPSITFSNHLITKQDLNDKFCNQLLNIYIKHNARFIITSDLLAEHIKNIEPNAKLICSVISPSILKDDPNFNETLFYQKMLDKFDTVVLRPEWTIAHIDDIDKLLKKTDKIEVLINQFCIANCPRNKEHYEWFIKNAKKQDLKNFCTLSYENKPPLFFNDDMMETLFNKGVKHFKLQGRDYSFNKIYDDLYSLFFNNRIYTKEEIRQEINNICIEIMQNNKLISFNIL